jgi:hypothetical protein
MATGSHADMHAEHRRWLDDEALWRDELAVWHKELEAALAGLKQTDAGLQDHRSGLEAHGEDLRTEAEALAGHETALAEFEHGSVRGGGEELIRLAKAHRDAAARHARRRNAHERLKRHHHTVMARAARLGKALAGPV